MWEGRCLRVQPHIPDGVPSRERPLPASTQPLGTLAARTRKQSRRRQVRLLHRWYPLRHFLLLFPVPLPISRLWYTDELPLLRGGTVLQLLSNILGRPALGLGQRRHSERGG